MDCIPGEIRWRSTTTDTSEIIIIPVESRLATVYEQRYFRHLTGKSLCKRVATALPVPGVCSSSSVLRDEYWGALEWTCNVTD